MNEIDDKVAAAEARTDTKFAQLIGRMDVMRADMRADMEAMRADMRADMGTMRANLRADMEVMRAALVGRMDALGAGLTARLDGIDARLTAVERDAAGMKFWVIGTGLVVFGLVIAATASGDQLFGPGISAGDIADAAARRAIERYLQQQP